MIPRSTSECRYLAVSELSEVRWTAASHHVIVNTQSSFRLVREIVCHSSFTFETGRSSSTPSYVSIRVYHAGRKMLSSDS